MTTSQTHRPRALYLTSPEGDTLLLTPGRSKGSPKGLTLLRPGGELPQRAVPVWGRTDKTGRPTAHMQKDTDAGAVRPHTGTVIRAVTLPRDVSRYARSDTGVNKSASPYGDMGVHTYEIG